MFEFTHPVLYRFFVRGIQLGIAAVVISAALGIMKFALPLLTSVAPASQQANVQQLSSLVGQAQVVVDPVAAQALQAAGIDPGGVSGDVVHETLERGRGVLMQHAAEPINIQKAAMNGQLFR